MLLVRFVSKSREMVAAGVGGVMATATDVALLVALVAGGVSIPVAAFLASAIGAVVNFVFNKHVAFQDRSPITTDQLVRFVGVALATGLALAVLMKLVALELGVPVLPAKLLCAAIVFVLWTYPAQRRLVFVRRDGSPASSLA